MFRYESKKIFSRSMNKIVLLILVASLIIVSIITINGVEFVDENGNSSTGLAAAKNLKEAKNQWSGYITEDVIAKAIKKEAVISASKEAKSSDMQENDKAYAKTQEFDDIRDVIASSFSGFGEYDYAAIDRITAKEAGQVYKNRETALKKQLETGEEKFSTSEKAFLTKQYENLKTPFYYEYDDGWQALFSKISSFILILALATGVLVSGIFSDEFQLKADSIFFSAKLGRTKAVRSKIATGFLLTTGIYTAFILIYSAVVLLVLGTDGANCPIQLELWKCMYNITYLQAYFLIVLGGYIGTLFTVTVTMLVSAKTHSTIAAAIVAFIILCTFPFLNRILPWPQACAFFPDQLMEIYVVLRNFELCKLGDTVFGVISVIIPIYAIVCIALQPVLYQVYRRAEVK